MVLCRLNVLVGVLFFVIFCSYEEPTEAVKLSPKASVNTENSQTSTGTNIEYLNSICGQEKPSVDAWGRFPWIVAILFREDNGLRYNCLGNLISSKTIVASAHCLTDSTVQNYIISTNWHGLNDWSDAGNFEVEKLILLPDDKEDLAILQLKQSVTFTDSINPICLWQGPEDVNEDKDNSGAVLSWGPNGRGKIQAIPKLVNVTVKSYSACIRSNFQHISLFPNGIICGEHEEGSDGMCIGDSGSGLMIKKGNKWMLRGILSYQIIDSHSENGCYPDKIAIFSDVVAQNEWIRSNTL